MLEEKKQSKQEDIKSESGYLKGNILEELQDSKPYVSEASYELLKFHGSYQGYDRDTATQLKKQGLEKKWEFMLRIKCPAGILTPEQYLEMDKICDQYANGTMRITTRQTFQFHCIVKADLKKHIADLNKSLISTLGGCGDVVRNVMCTPSAKRDSVHKKIIEDTYKIAEFCAPKTTSYHEIWLDGKNIVDSKNEEPLYSQQYLPRKFKISVSVPEDNTVDALSHDLAIILVYENDILKGYNFYVGGGLGMTHNKPETYPRLATPAVFIKPESLLDGVDAVVKIQRDYGDRKDRKHSRLKYLVEEKGMYWFCDKFKEYFGENFEHPHPIGNFKIPDHMGWHTQGDGNLALGIVVNSGRIADNDKIQYRTAFRQIISKYKPNVSLTPDQNIIIRDINPKDKVSIENELQEYNVKLREKISDVSRYFLACVSFPTCGKALAEAERVQPDLVEKIESVMTKYDLLDKKISIRITGCPNGCARPYIGDIGIVGRIPGHYALYIGGDFEGTRLNTKILDRVPYNNLEDVFDIMFKHYKAKAENSEGYGDFVHRVGIEEVSSLITDKLSDYKWSKI